YKLVRNNINHQKHSKHHTLPLYHMANIVVLMRIITFLAVDLVLMLVTLAVTISEWCQSTTIPSVLLLDQIYLILELAFSRRMKLI
ncbi:hypothetical protein ACJX0J_017978, partial [Zea mays]